MIAERVIDWQRAHGRHDLPWQLDRDPYRVWISEVMLQQTQVGAVIPYFQRFIGRFPDVDSLARAGLDDVLELWSGLGYYSRARNLHACARVVVEAHGGEFPREPARLAELPGIGRSTAAAIASLAFGVRAAILDGNVKRVLCRAFGVEGHPGAPAVERELWAIAERELPQDGLEAYTQGMMDLGATVCTRTRPACDRCPLADACVARAQGRTAALPAARPRRATPTRATAMLVLLRDGAVLVERRAPSGIWGGLWSLPEVPMEALPDDAAAVDAQALPARLEHLGVAVRGFRELPAFTHAFTHFRLEVRPMLASIDPGKTVLAQDAGALRWLPLAEAAGAGLPRPVKTLLMGLHADQITRCCPR